MSGWPVAVARKPIGKGDVTMTTYRAGIIGDPVVHSLSPAMHTAAFQQIGLDAVYERWLTPAAALPTRIASLRAPEMLGASVTLPHKLAVIPLLDGLELDAARIGAVNTIYKREDGALIGANTDAPGFLESLRMDGNFDPAGTTALILGASGAARAAVFALLDAGAAQIIVANRSLARAEDLLADALNSLYDEAGGTTSHTASTPDTPPRLIALALDDSALGDWLTQSHLLVNATALGWHGDESPLTDLPLPAHLLVCDMVYRQTSLLKAAHAAGARTLDGFGMLLRQGTQAFTRWTGQPAPVDVMQAALRESLQTRPV